LVLGLSSQPIANADCLSDWCANQRSGARSGNLTYKYGGTHSGAARSYNNYRWGYGAGANNDFHSPSYPSYSPPGGGYRANTPAQEAEARRLIQKTDSFINSINNSPYIRGY
jgi:hypothetical protein